MQSLFYFLIALAILVIVHEFGHFWVAKRCGVKVLTFSVGFGKPLWRRKSADGTEYMLAMIPLGGFVKMLDEREGDVAEGELDKTFNRKPLSSRVAIVAAGPIANIVFALIAYWFIFVVGMTGISSIIGDVTMSSPSDKAQLMVGDQITSINGQNTPTWQSVLKQLIKIAESGGIAELVVNRGGIEDSRTLAIPKLDIHAMGARSILNELGLTPIRIELRPIIGAIVKNGAAYKSGLRVGDELLSYNGEPINDWMGWVELVKKSPDIPLNITVDRSGNSLSLVITPDKSLDNTGMIGASVDPDKTTIPDNLVAKLRYSPIAALKHSCLETWQFTEATLTSLWGMVTGTVSTKNLGGPISIAQYAGASADRGIVDFINFLAMISISLGLLNLLPIPVLDGGHLMMYLIEWLRGSPLSEEAQLQGQRIGVVLLLMLMLMAFFNDLSRLFG